MNEEIWHNPKNLDSPGEGWRFVLRSELSHLPPDTEFWFNTKGEWKLSMYAGGEAKFHFDTYRTQAKLPTV